MPPPLINWASQCATLSQRFAARVAVRDAAGTLDYTGLFAAAAGIGGALRDDGAAHGEPVASLFRNGRHAVAAAYGALLAGVGEMPLNIGATEAERLALLAMVGVRRVVCGGEHAAFFSDHGFVVHVADQIAGVSLDTALFPPVAREAWGRIVFTSGTTGLPKAIVYRQDARLLGNLLLQASLPWLPERRADGAASRVLLMTPFAHGASLQAFAWLDQGGEVVLLDGVQVDRVAELLGAAEIDALFAGPTVLAKLAASFPGRRFAGVRTVFTGTAQLPPSVYAAARAMFGPVVRITYGKSEVFNPITVLPPDDTEAYYAAGGAADGSACVGWPAPGVELRVDAAGEVAIRAQHMSAGWIDAAGFHAWPADGFHATGDIGRVDADGRLHLVARLSDAMKSGGYKIYPQEIERALADAGGGEVVVVGLLSEHWGEVVVAVAERPEAGWEAAARAACADLAAYKRPRFFVALDELPRNAQGKTVRRHVRDAVLRRHRLTDGARPSLEPIG